MYTSWAMTTKGTKKSVAFLIFGAAIRVAFAGLVLGMSLNESTFVTMVAIAGSWMILPGVQEISALFHRMWPSLSEWMCTFLYMAIGMVVMSSALLLV